MSAPGRDAMWRVTGSEETTAVWVEDEDGKRVCTVRNCENDYDRATLIAAAPELLAALEGLCGLAETRGHLHEYKSAVLDARAVIAKANGVKP